MTTSKMSLVISLVLNGCRGAESHENAPSADELVPAGGDHFSMAQCIAILTEEACGATGQDPKVRGCVWRQVEYYQHATIRDGECRMEAEGHCVAHTEVTIHPGCAVSDERRPPGCLSGRYFHYRLPTGRRVVAMECSDPLDALECFLGGDDPPECLCACEFGTDPPPTDVVESDSIPTTDTVEQDDLPDQ